MRMTTSDYGVLAVYALSGEWVLRQAAVAFN
jgi:hypothetical protein